MIFSTSLSRRLAPLALLCIAGVASAATHVKDDAGMFGAPAAQQAEQQLADLQQRSGKYVIVETMSEPPADVRDQIVADASQRNAAILKLAETRAAAARADVYVLINKTPGNLQIAERRSLQAGGLPAATRTQIADAMLSSFKQKQFDQGLTTGISMLGQSIGTGAAANAPVAAPTPPPVPPVVQTRRDDPATPTPPPAFPTASPTASHGVGGFSCCTIAGIGLLVVIVLAVVRRMGNRNVGPANYGGGPPVGGYPPSGYPQGGYPQQGGYPPQAGGGFGRGVAGGLLGGVLGSVLGNRMSHGSDGGQSGGGIFGGGGGGGGGNAGSPPADTGYTGSGGDFGSSSDAGGSSASDYTGGGGDFGGGGDAGGGGGGDSGGSSGGDF